MVTPASVCEVFSLRRRMRELWVPCEDGTVQHGTYLVMKKGGRESVRKGGRERMRKGGSERVRKGGREGGREGGRVRKGRRE